MKTKYFMFIGEFNIPAFSLKNLKGLIPYLSFFLKIDFFP